MHVCACRVLFQAQPIHTDVVTRLLGNRVAVSPIVTVEPRRRKFHKPITLTIPLPRAAHKGMTNQYSGDAPTLRLLCSITGGQTKAQWEDVTGSTPLTFVNDCVSFTTTVSARFWLIDCRQVSDVTKFASELYQEAVLVPFMAKFVVFAKRHEPLEAQLRVFCMTDDREEKTLESQEHFAEVAKSRDVEVLEDTPQYLEFAGNLVPITKSGEQLALTFEAFKENRVAFNARVKDMHQEPMGRVAFMKEPRGKHQDAPQTPVCNLNIKLPDPVEFENVPLEKKYGFVQDTGLGPQEMIHRDDLHLTATAKELGADWPALARQLNIPTQEIQQIRDEVPASSDQQAVTMLRIWTQRMGPAATDSALEKALKNIGREDVIRKCMSKAEKTPDEVERALARVQLTGLSPASVTSVTRTTVVTTSSADERDIMKARAFLLANHTTSTIITDAESAENTSSGSARAKPTAAPAPVGDDVGRQKPEGLVTAVGFVVSAGALAEHRDLGGCVRDPAPNHELRSGCPVVDEFFGIIRGPDATQTEVRSSSTTTSTAVSDSTKTTVVERSTRSQSTISTSGKVADTKPEAKTEKDREPPASGIVPTRERSLDHDLKAAVRKDPAEVKKAEPKKEEKKTSPKREVPPPKKEPPKKEKKDEPKKETTPPKKEESSRKDSTPPKKEEKKESPKKDIAPKKDESPRKESAPKKEEPASKKDAPKREDFTASKKDGTPKKEQLKKDELKKEQKKDEPKKEAKKDSPKKEAPKREEAKKIKSPTSAPPEPPKKPDPPKSPAEEVVVASSTATSHAIMSEVIKKTELPRAKASTPKRGGTPVDELSAELLEQIVQDDKELAFKGPTFKKSSIASRSSRDVVETGPGGIMARNVEIERYIKETSPEEIVIPEYRHETRTVTSKTVAVSREGLIGELGEALKDFDQLDLGPTQATVTTQRTTTTHVRSSPAHGDPDAPIPEHSGPIITEIGDDEAERIAAQQALRQPDEMASPPVAFRQMIDGPFDSGDFVGKPTSVLRETQQLLPDGTLQHTVTRVTTTTFVQEEGQPPVEVSTKQHESEAAASDADTSQVSVSSLPEDEGTASSGLQHLQDPLRYWTSLPSAAQEPPTREFLSGVGQTPTVTTRRVCRRLCVVEPPKDGFVASALVTPLVGLSPESVILGSVKAYEENLANYSITSCQLIRPASSSRTSQSHSVHPRAEPPESPRHSDSLMPSFGRSRFFTWNFTTTLDRSPPKPQRPLLSSRVPLGRQFRTTPTRTVSSRFTVIFIHLAMRIRHIHLAAALGQHHHPYL
ncbi:hypothetical protein BIW11_09084 [Tropilaelaps mercedesae]|uniref:Death domain-containing protein n=1 Tax=Tropilaelaps mercedesae TaxID=418985 RepID=A0A1V9XLL2_9ACAR|nr:hypothetical protein BIW11_09084 [Tropilaelaps mercedesae]